MNTALTEQLVTQQILTSEVSKSKGEEAFDHLRESGLLKGTEGMEVTIDPETNEYVIGLQGTVRTLVSILAKKAGKEDAEIATEKFYTRKNS